MKRHPVTDCLHKLCITRIKTHGHFSSYHYLFFHLKTNVMRFLLKVTAPHEQFNAYVKDGSIDKKMQAIMAEGQTNSPADSKR